MVEKAAADAHVIVAQNYWKLRILRLLGHQDWIRYGLRERLLRHWQTPDNPQPLTFTVPFFGMRYSGNLNRFLDWCVFFYGAFEKAELFLLRDLCATRSDVTFVDIGANVGQHTLFMSSHAGSVLAFEPFANVRAELNKRLVANAVSNVRVHDVGLGDSDALLEYYAPTGANTGTGSFVPSHTLANSPDPVFLQVVHGDRYFRALGLSRLDIVKIDVEGFESRVLIGLRETLREFRPAVLMEISPTTKRDIGSSDDLLRVLPDNYSVRRVRSNRPFLGIFNRPGYVLEEVDLGHVADANLLLLPAEWPFAN